MIDAYGKESDVLMNKLLRKKKFSAYLGLSVNQALISSKIRSFCAERSPELAPEEHRSPSDVPLFPQPETATLVGFVGEIPQEAVAPFSSSSVCLATKNCPIRDV